MLKSNYLQRMDIASKHMLGYPIRCKSKNTFVINNLGDPFQESNYHLNTNDLELEILKYFANLYNLQKYWGYVTTGGTEGNLCGLLRGREQVPNATIYCSDQTHYSIDKAAYILGLRLVKIPSQSNGEVDYSKLEAIISTPAIYVANVGTTMKGAIDDIPRIKSILKNTQHYIHVDAALFGLTLPFLDGPKIDFNQGFQSIAVSGHKMLGVPIPCGVFLATETISKNRFIPYLNSFDTTITGSRSGLATAYFWEKIQKNGLRRSTNYCIGLLNYSKSKFEGISYPCWANPFSNILVFQRPSNSVCRKWQLVSEKDLSHLIVMPHVNKRMIGKFIHDLTSCRKDTYSLSFD